MENKVNFKTCFASVVSELQQSDVYLTLKARLFKAPDANLNGARVTLAFLNEIVENQSKYIGLPLYADVKNLANGNYKRLGHLYDPNTGEFHSTQIGSFYKFEKEICGESAYLIGYARVPKRNKAIANAIGELFTNGSLKFSFEIMCGNYKQLSDGTIEIDVGDNNQMEGEAIVSLPACEDAVALELVAECNSITEKGDEALNTTDVNTIAAADTAIDTKILNTDQITIDSNSITIASTDSFIPAVCEVSPTTEQAEEMKEVENTEEDTAACNKEEDDTASCNKENTKEEISEEVSENISEEVTEQATEDTTSIEAQAVEEISIIENSELVKLVNKIGEAMLQKLTDEISQLKQEIAALKEECNNNVDTSENVTAEFEETKTVTAESADINPFVSEMSTPKAKYSLLESVNKTDRASMLEKA